MYDGCPFFHAISVGLMACINLNVLFSNSNSSMQQLENFTSLTFQMVTIVVKHI